MPIQAQTADGVTHEFPDGTPQPIINKAMKRYTLEKSGGGKVKDWADVPAAALKNAPESAANVVKGVVDAVTHPIDTLSATSDLIGGVANKLGADEANAWLADKGLANRRAPEDIARENQAAEAAGENISNRYGSMENLKQTLAKDPVGVAADALGVVSGGQASIGRVPTVAKAAVAVPKAVVTKAKALNKLKVDYPEAAGDVARQLDELSSSYNLKDVSTSNQGAKGAVNKAHTDNKVEIDEHYATLRDMLDPQKNTSPEDYALRVEAGKAFASADHKQMDHSVRAQIAAVEKLVGNTQQGAKMVHGLKKQVELNRLADRIHGGVSRLTDKFNPVSEAGEGRLGSTAATKMLGSAFLHGQMGPMAPYTAGAHAAAVVGGQLIDTMTGRKSLPRLYTKQNIKTPKQNIGEGLPDIYEDRRNAQAAATQASEAADAATAKAKADAALVKSRATARKALDASFKVSDKAEGVATRSLQIQDAMKAAGLSKKVSDQLTAKKALDKSFKDTAKAEAVATKDLKATEATAAKTAKAIETQTAAKAAAEAKVLERASKETIAAQKAAETKAQREKAAADKKAASEKSAADKKAEYDAMTLSAFEAKQKQQFLSYMPKKERLAAQAPKMAKATPEMEVDIEKRGDFYYNKKNQMVDSKGKRVFNEKAYRLATTNIKTLTTNARSIASAANTTANAAILKALDELDLHHGRDFQKEREGIVKDALSKAMTMEQHDTIWEALQPLADVFKPKD